jgi:hypothetical protein
MLEHVQQIIYQLQDDLDLINMKGIPVTDLDDSQKGPSSPEFIYINEIVG